MNKELDKIKAHFEEVAGSWNGDSPQGEDCAMSAKDILDRIESIEQEKADWERLSEDIRKGLVDLEVMVVEHNENY
jgi:hypothetical protein